MGVPKVGGAFLEVPKIAIMIMVIITIIYKDLYWGPPCLGNYHMRREHYEPFSHEPLHLLQLFGSELEVTINPKTVCKALKILCS